MQLSFILILLYHSLCS